MIDFRNSRHRPTAAIIGCRHGVTAVELIVSAVLLMAIMSFITTLGFRINLVWKDVNHHRIATGELSNQLEEITKMTPAEAKSAISILRPSSLCARSLPNPQLSGELIEDELGNMVVMRINWNRRNPGKPVELAGWILPELATGLENSQGKNSVSVIESDSNDSGSSFFESRKTGRMMFVEAIQ